MTFSLSSLVTKSNQSEHAGEDYYRSFQITLHGEACTCETWHISHFWKSNDRHTKVTHNATGATFPGHSKETYRDSESEAQNSAKDWIVNRQREIMTKKLQEIQIANAKILQKLEEERIENEKKLNIANEQKRKETIARLDLLNEKLAKKQNNLNEMSQHLETIHNRIISEQKDIDERFIVENNNNYNARVIIIIGHTGDGKSTFCNRLNGDISAYADEGTAFPVSGSRNSCTQSLSVGRTTIDGINILFIDTPGYGDTGGEELDRQHGNRVCEFLKGCSGINAFVLIRNTRNIRFDPSIQAMYLQYANMFGSEFFSRLIIIGTNVDNGNKKYDRDNKEKSLREDVEQIRGQLEQSAGNINIPVIPIGFKNYVESLKLFAHAIPVSKFTCERIKSPIDDLKVELNRIQLNYNSLNQEMREIQNEILAVRKNL